MKKTDRWLVYMTSVLVFLVMIASFSLSFDATRDLASHYVNHEISWLVPVTIDMAMVVFSFVRLFAVSVEEKPLLINVLIGGFTLTSVFFNVSHTIAEYIADDKYPLYIGLVLAVAIPVVLMVCTECLFWIVHIGVSRSEAVPVAKPEVVPTRSKDVINRLLEHVKQFPSATQNEIAKALKVNRVTVSRHLKALQQDGRIVKNGNSLTVI